MSVGSGWGQVRVAAVNRAAAAASSHPHARIGNLRSSSHTTSSNVLALESLHRPGHDEHRSASRKSFSASCTELLFLALH
jgi:hypothetical protein